MIGFPLGATAPEVKAFETQNALDHGATEIDMVINIGALKARDLELVARDIRGVVTTAHAGGAIVKVIIEAVLLTDEEKTIACLLSKEAGADFVKTSTGFASGGATVHDVALMRKAVGPEMGVKAAGGVRTYEDAENMIKAGATRIGASAGVKIIQGPSRPRPGCARCPGQRRIIEPGASKSVPVEQRPACRIRRADMLIARVIGTTVSTIKDEKLTGRKLLIVRQTDETGSPAGKPYVAVDTVDAGIGDLVLTCAGSSARQTTITKDTPVDAVIMAVINSLEVDGKVVFRKS